jgi:dTDP-4-dehydrorhamnose reductase
LRVLITGASGLLGLNACLMQASHFDIYGVVHHTCLKGVPFQLISADLTQEDVIGQVVDQVKPDLVINCAAMAQVDQCELMPELAERVNAWMPGVAASFCKHRQIPFVHISTDAVFDGEEGGYRETDTPNPLSVYAQTKLKGEERVLHSNPDALIARVNFFGHSLSGKRSLAEFFLHHLLEGDPINGFMDVIFAPLYVKHLVTILFEMVDKNLHGLFHVVGEEKISKFDFGRRIANKLSLDEDLITPIVVRDAGLTAKRSPNLFLDVSRLKDAGIEIPSLDQGLDAFIADYQNNWHMSMRAYQS